MWLQYWAIAPRIVELAAKISASVDELQELLSARGLPSPSFEGDSPECLPADMSHLQDAVLDATAELHELLLDPMSLVFKFSAISNMISLDAVCRFHIADMIPPGGQVSFGDISKQTGLDESLVRRLIRYAMAMRIFKEPEPGMVAHTKVSKFLTIPYANAWLSHGAQEAWPASARMVDAMQKWPSSEEPNETGFCLANNTEKSIYGVLGEDPVRAARFASAMKAFDHFPGYVIRDVPSFYDWASLNNAFIVDVGGSKGHVAIELAKSFGDIKLLVQDMGMVVEGAESGVPDQLKGRVEFMAHELFDPQTVQAGVYFFRAIFHNWSDKYAVRILKAQIPALRPGAKILIQDAIMPDPGHIPLWRERDMRAVDLNMGCFFNARERYLHEWKALLAAADELFVLQRVIEPKRSSLAILEIIWDVSGSAEA
ncbi:sterigmatocystin 8-O-methyltransferase [Xylariaceae sp. FL0662B]|nr:sterigmatocystin 8-O-methyltransferase [Xylariaceae sp. FL0662B]